METNHPTNACNLTPRQPGLQHRCQNWPKKVPDPDRGGQCWLLLLPPGIQEECAIYVFFFRAAFFSGREVAVRVAACGCLDVRTDRRREAFAALRGSQDWLWDGLVVVRSDRRREPGSHLPGCWMLWKGVCSCCCQREVPKRCQSWLKKGAGTTPSGVLGVLTCVVPGWCVSNSNAGCQSWPEKGALDHAFWGAGVYVCSKLSCRPTSQPCCDF